MSRKDLTPQQAKFVEEYLIDLNATQAAARAGYKDPNFGRQVITKPNVSEAIAKAIEDRSIRTKISADNVLRELARLAFSDVRKFFDENGKLKPVSELDDDAAACLAAIDVSTKDNGEIATRIKIWDKTRNLENLAKHLGLLKERIEATGANGRPLQTDVTHRWTLFPPEPATVEEWLVQVEEVKRLQDLRNHDTEDTE